MPRGEGVLQVELLISAGFVFALFQLPAWLDTTFEQVEVHLSKDYFLLPFMIYYAATLVTYVLIFSFVTHLVLRAFWVGLAGLRSAFPDGIRWENVKSGPGVTEFYRRELPDLSEVIDSTDRLSKMIFSASAASILTVVYGVLMMFLMLPLAFVIHRFVAPESRLSDVVAILALVMALGIGLVQGLDKLREKYAFLDRSKFVHRLVDRTMKVLLMASPLRFSGQIQLLFASNISKKVFYTFTYISVFGLVGIFLLNLLISRGALRFDSYTYFSDNSGELWVDPQFYEDQRPPSEIFRTTPSIQSDMITDPYVRLWVPYSPRAYNEDLAEKCSGVEPLNPDGIRWRKKEIEDTETLRPVLECLMGLYAVRLDGEVMEALEWNFSRHPKTDQRGIVAYIPTAGLTPGSHLLKLERRDPPEDLSPRRREYSILFWI